MTLKKKLSTFSRLSKRIKCLRKSKDTHLPPSIKTATTSISSFDSDIFKGLIKANCIDNLNVYRCRRTVIPLGCLKHMTEDGHDRLHDWVSSNSGGRLLHDAGHLQNLFRTLPRQPSIVNGALSKAVYTQLEALSKSATALAESIYLLGEKELQACNCCTIATMYGGSKYDGNPDYATALTSTLFGPPPYAFIPWVESLTPPPPPVDPEKMKKKKNKPPPTWPEPPKFPQFKLLPSELQDLIWEKAAAPPTCPVRQVLQHSMRHASYWPGWAERMEEHIQLAATTALGPQADLARLLLLPECGPAGVMFRGADFGLWNACVQSRSAMVRVYREAVPFRRYWYTIDPYENPCVVHHLRYSTQDCNPTFASLGNMFKQPIQRLVNFADNALQFQADSQRLAKLVLQDYAAIEGQASVRYLVNASRYAQYMAGGGASKPAPAHEPIRRVDKAPVHMLVSRSPIGKLLQELFLVDDEMLDRVSRIAGTAEADAVLRHANPAVWPVPAIWQRQHLMRLAKHVACNVFHDL